MGQDGETAVAGPKGSRTGSRYLSQSNGTNICTLFPIISRAFLLSSAGHTIRPGGRQCQGQIGVPLESVPITPFVFRTRVRVQDRLLEQAS